MSMAAENRSRLHLDDVLASENAAAVTGWLQAVDDHGERAYQVLSLIHI